MSKSNEHSQTDQKTQSKTASSAHVNRDSRTGQIERYVPVRGQGPDYVSKNSRRNER